MNISFLRSRNFWWYWLPPLAWCAVVLTLSGDLGSAQNTLGILKWLVSWLPLSPAQFDLIHYYVRKCVGHFANYGFLYFLWFRAFAVNLYCRPKRAVLYSLALCLGLALADEGRQSLFVSRGSSLWDVSLDMAGAVAAALLIAIVWTFRTKAAACKPLPHPAPGE